MPLEERQLAEYVAVRHRLAKGMTVQSDCTRTRLAHYVHCVTCGWSSGFMSYQTARSMACEPCPLRDDSWRHNDGSACG